MKLRIIVSESNLGKYADANQPKTLYQSGKLIIQGSDDVRTISLIDGRKAFLFGNLVGLRTSQDEIVPCVYASANLEELIRTNSIKKCQELLEGPFLLVVAGPKDECSVCADSYGQRDLYYQIDGETKLFVSDLSLLPVSPVQNGFDQVGLAHTLTVFGFRPPKRHTIY